MKLAVPVFSTKELPDRINILLNFIEALPGAMSQKRKTKITGRWFLNRDIKIQYTLLKQNLYLMECIIKHDSLMQGNHAIIRAIINLIL